MSSRTIEFSLGSEDVDNIYETDDIPREAKFTLFTRPLDSTPMLSAQPLTHWAVVVEYLDVSGKVFTFEAGQDGKNTDRILANRSSTYPNKQEKGKMIKLGWQTISPKQLLTIAQNVSLNGKCYNILMRNCQAWCKEFCSEISKDFLEHQFWDSENLFWISLASAGGLLLISSLIFGALGSSKKEKENQK